MAGVDVCQSAQLFVVASQKCRSAANASRGFHNDAIQFNQKCRQALGLVNIWVAQQLSTEWLHALLYRRGDVERFFTFSGHVQQEKKKPPRRRHKKVIVVAADAGCAIQGTD